MTKKVLSQADVDEVTLPDGRVVRNLSAEEYDATYAEGTVHGPGIPETDAPEVNTT